MYSLEDLEMIKKFLNYFNIYYECGEYYESDGEGFEVICGHWIKIRETDLETDEISNEDKIYNGIMED